MGCEVKSFADIRTVVKNGVKYYCLADVAKLAYVNDSKKPLRYPGDYLRLILSKRFAKAMSEMEKYKNIDVAIRDTSDVSGHGLTFAVPEIMTHFASWISVEFAAKMAAWIQSWRQTEEKNESEYCAAIDVIVNDMSPEQEEAEVRDALAAELPDAKTEVKCDAGRIDIMSRDEIIEVKHVGRAMHALGQILCYAEDWPNKKMRIHLYGDGKPSASFFKVCADHGITVTM